MKLSKLMVVSCVLLLSACVTILLMILFFPVGAYAEEATIEEREYELQKAKDELLETQFELASNIFRTILTSDYYGVIRTDYLHNSDLQLEAIHPSGFSVSFDDTTHTIIPETPATITSNKATELFLGKILNKRWSYEINFNSLGKKSYQFKQGDKFMLNGEEYRFTEDSTLYVSGFGMGVFWKYDYLQFEKFSAYAKIGGLIKFAYVDGDGRYELATGCTSSFRGCDQDVSFRVGATGNGDESDYFDFNIPVGVEFALLKGIALRAEYDPLAASTDIGLMYKKTMARNQYLR